MSLAEDAATDRTRGWGRGMGYAAALGLTAAGALAAVLLDRFAPTPSLALVFVLPVVTAAAAFGWGPALLAAATGVLAFNFLLTEPRYTFRVDDPDNVAAMILLAAVAAIVSAVAASARRRALEARENADRAAALQGLAQALVAAGDRPAIMRAVVEALARFFKAPAVVLADEGEDLQVAALHGLDGLQAADLEAGAWSLAARLPTRGGVYPHEGARFDFWPLRPRSPLAPAVVIGLSLGGGRERPEAPERLVRAVAGYLELALEREVYARQALEAGVRTRGEELKADLLASVSHDLKTPLSTILFTLQSLQKFEGAHDAATRAELLAIAEAETARLSSLVGDLLNMNRLEADAVPVEAAPASLADLAAAAVDRAHAALAGHPVQLRVDAAAPPVMIDFALAETALANVLENAGKYAPPGSPILVRGGRAGAQAVLEVLDEGPGFPQPASRMFEKFSRGVEGDGRAPGLGLGLAIARGFLNAQGGGIEARQRPDGRGGLVRLTLPLAGEARA